jgi:hypothetical protein
MAVLTARVPLSIHQGVSQPVPIIAFAYSIVVVTQILTRITKECG